MFFQKKMAATLYGMAAIISYLQLHKSHNSERYTFENMITELYELKKLNEACHSEATRGFEPPFI